MAKKQRKHKHVPLSTKPELLHFVELDEFGSDWRELSLNVERDLWDSQTLLMAAPTLGPLVRGTSGLRKLRFAPRGWNIGKRGAVRICYAYYHKHSIVLLVMAYTKGRKDTLAAGEKQGIAQYLLQVERWLDAHA